MSAGRCRQCGVVALGTLCTGCRIARGLRVVRTPADKSAALARLAATDPAALAGPRTGKPRSVRATCKWINGCTCMNRPRAIWCPSQCMDHANATRSRVVDARAGLRAECDSCGHMALCEIDTSDGSRACRAGQATPCHRGAR